MSQRICHFMWTAVGVFSPDTAKRRKLVCVRDYEPGDTYRYIWQKSYDVKLWYVIYRFVHAVLNLILLLISFFHVFLRCPLTEENKDRYTCIGERFQVNQAWPFYLTSWGLMLNFVQSLMGLILVGNAYHRQSAVRQKQAPNETSPISPEPVQITTGDNSVGGPPKHTDTPLEPPEPGSWKPTENTVVRTSLREHRFLSFTGSYWGAHSVASTLTILIDIVYWVALNDYSKKLTRKYFFYVSEHAINFVLMTADCFIVAFPILALHVVHLVFLAIAYLVVTFVYYHAGGLDKKFRRRCLYHFLDWSKPLLTSLNLVVFLVFAIVTMLIIMLSDFAKHRYFRPRPPTASRGSTISLVEPASGTNAV